MDILIHLGLNKCASTYIQAALSGAQARLRRAGVFYGVEGPHRAHYGVSRHYGFGPDARGVTPRSILWLAERARERGCTRMIVSSEYFSLARPPAVARFMADLGRSGAHPRFVFFSRPAEAWIRSLYNQFIKMGGDPGRTPSINDFADRILASGTAHVHERWSAWARAADRFPIAHYRLEEAALPEAVLEPFARFARIALPPPPGGAANASLSPGGLWLTALLRRLPPSPELDRVLSALSAHDLSWVPVPRAFLELDEARRARIRSEVEEPRLALPHDPLPLPKAA